MEHDKTRDPASTSAQLRKYAEDLNRSFIEMKKAHQDLQAAYEDTIARLVIASEYRDEDTGNHITRISRYSALIAEKYGLHEKKVQDIRMAAPMHDVGKIGIPDSILLKPGRLTVEEFEIIKGHTLIGARILGGSRSQLLELASEIALSHHEKWNGKGYPAGFSGTDIPLSGRIVAISDVFDALTSRRPYKEPFTVERAVEIIRSERGEHFDPDLTDVFLANLERVVEIKDEVGQ